MVITSTPRRLHIAAMANDTIQPNCQSSPVSMKYSVHGCKSSGEVISHNSGSEFQSDGRIMLNWNIKLLQGISICSALFCAISLQFYLVSNDRMRGKSATTRNYLDLMKDIIYSFDIAIVVCSIATFFITSLQLLFIMKIAKQNAQNIDIAIQYIQQTSFLRVVCYSFWFASIIMFLIVILINCSIDPSRSLASKCVSLTLGASAIFLCVWFSIRSIYFWGKTTYGHVYKEDYYNHLSTLV